MESGTTTCKSRDILSSPWRVFILYWLPAIAIVVAGVPAVSSGWRTAVWIVALATMGTACIVNALRCGRVHCYLTGPFFLLGRDITSEYTKSLKENLSLRLEEAERVGTGFAVPAPKCSKISRAHSVAAVA